MSLEGEIRNLQEQIDELELRIIKLESITKHLLPE